MVRIGAHLHDGDPLAQALALGADAVQFFLGDPQGWKGPVFPGEPAGVRAAFADADVEAFIHAPYVINVASPNNRIRIPSRKLLAQQLEAAAAIGATGLIVHGGHVTAGVDPEEGYDSWRKAVERIDRPVPMLIENTAGGDGAMARSFDAIARLWEVVTEAAEGGGEVGFCLDTCHAFAAGTLASPRAPSTRPSSSTWCAPPVRRPCVRPRTRAPTSAGCVPSLRGNGAGLAAAQTGDRRFLGGLRELHGRGGAARQR